MSKHMQRDLDALQQQLLKMAGNVEEAIHSATRALETRDAELAERVIAGDDAIDRLENEVQEECLKILALHQPVAVDLRRISSILLITTDLERMGDLASGLAEKALELSHPPYAEIPARLRPMTLRATEMVNRALNSLVRSDADEARAVVAMDDDVDADNDAILAEVIARMKLPAGEIDSGLALHAAVRYVERIADHATNIAEDVIYLVEGSMVRHLSPAPQPAPAS